MFTLTITEPTATAFKLALREAANEGPPKIDVFSTEFILQELRDRLRPDGQVVQIVPFDTPSDPAETAAVEPEKPVTKRTRSKPAEEKAVEAVIQHEEPKKVEPSATADAMLVKPVSKEDVLAALNAHAAANGGSVAAREIMFKIGGFSRLADIYEHHWPALVEALKVAA